MIDVANASKRFGDVTALDDFSYRFGAGTTTALIGPSGCGKSTLLRAIINLVSLDNGTIRFQNKPVTSTSEQHIRQQTGYVIQQGGLFPHLTCLENIRLVAKYLGWSETRISERVSEVTELARLREQQLTSYPSQLSGGQRQRVSLMRALMHDPDVLLLDEPLGALDSIVRTELQQDLKEIFDNLGKTVIIVTHDLAEATYFSSELVLMRSGGLVQRGSLHDLSSNPKSDFVHRFVDAHRTAAGILFDS